ncbi:MAG: hypothetical protein U1A77_12625 [Pirellulales bacterium]
MLVWRPLAGLAAQWLVALWLAPCLCGGEPWMQVGLSRSLGTNSRDSAEARVTFDVDQVVGARDVTSESDRLDDPAGRRVRVVLPVSVLLPPDSSRRLEEVLVRVENSERLSRVVDFAPRTSLAATGAGPVRFERKEESQRSLDFQLRGVYPAIADGHVKGSEQKRATTESSWEQAPELELCVASGLVNRGYGAYFKFKPSKRSTLEGTHSLELELRAPADWRGDCWVVRCSAYTREETLVGSEDRLRLWAERSFLVALYELGDEQGRVAAEALMLAEARLRRAMWAERRKGESGWSPNGLREFGQILSGVDAKDAAVRGSSAVKLAAANFEAARRDLIRPGTRLANHSLERLPSVDAEVAR